MALTYEQCLGVIESYKDFLTEQSSVQLASYGKRTKYDDLLDSKRDLLIAVNKRLETLLTESEE